MKIAESKISTIHNAVAHELVKQADQKGASKKLNEKGAFDKASGILRRFIETTDKAYNRRPKALGNFDSNTTAYPFQTLLNEYLSKKDYSEENFLTLTEEAMELLVASSTNILKATGGVVIFMHYDEKFMVLLLSRKKVFNLKDFVLEDLDAIDIDFMRYAVKIDAATFISTAENKDPYISFIRGTAQKVSDYFLDFIGCKDYVSPQKSTEQMIDAARRYMATLPIETEERRSIEQKILSYCVTQRKAGLPVHISAISPLINPEKDDGFIEYINIHEIKCSDVFEVDPKSLKKLKRYEYRASKWSLSFDHDLYTNNKIVYNKENRTIIIKDVPEDFSLSLDLTTDEKDE